MNYVDLYSKMAALYRPQMNKTTQTAINPSQSNNKKTTWVLWFATWKACFSIFWKMFIVFQNVIKQGMHICSKVGLYMQQQHGTYNKGLLINKWKITFLIEMISWFWYAAAFWWREYYKYWDIDTIDCHTIGNNFQISKKTQEKIKASGGFSLPQWHHMADPAYCVQILLPVYLFYFRFITRMNYQCLVQQT